MGLKWSTGNIPDCKTDVEKETATGIITKGYENGPEAAGTGVGGPGAYPFNGKKVKVPTNGETVS